MAKSRSIFEAEPEHPVHPNVSKPDKCRSSNSWVASSESGAQQEYGGRLSVKDIVYSSTRYSVDQKAYHTQVWE